MSGDTAAPPGGLRYYPDFLTPAEERRLLEIIDAQPWSKVFRRRQQFYGEIYYHTTQTVRSLQILPQIIDRAGKCGARSFVSYH